jgi:hypothetical protein
MPLLKVPGLRCLSNICITTPYAGLGATHTWASESLKPATPFDLMVNPMRPGGLTKTFCLST